MREHLKAPRTIIGLIVVTLLLTLISFYFPNESFISTYIALSYIIISVSTILVIMESKREPKPSMMILLMIALFVTMTCHLIANSFIIKDQIEEYVKVDFSITIQSIIAFNIIVAVIYLLALIIFESLLTDKKTRAAVTSISLVIILCMTFFSSFLIMGSTIKDDRTATVSISYATMTELVVFEYDHDINLSSNTTTETEYQNFTDDYWNHTDETMGSANHILNNSGMNMIFQQLDERKLGIIIVFDELSFRPVLSLTVYLNLVNGTVEDIEEGCNNVTIPLELTPAEGGSGLASSYITYAVDKIAMEDLGGYGLAKDGLYDVVLFAKYSNYRTFIDHVEKYLSDGEITPDEARNIALDVLQEHLITIAPVSELQDIDNTILSSGKTQQSIQKALEMR